MKEAIQYLRERKDTPLVVFVGPACRTWYADETSVCAVMEILREARMYRPVHTDPRGFDLMISNISHYLGLVGYRVEPEARDSEGRSIRDHSMLDGAAMVVAFPVEKHSVSEKPKRHDWRTADPALASTIEAMGLPVLAVYRDGSTQWFEP